MLTTLWSRELLTARLSADIALDRATHLPVTTRAQLHLDLLNTATALEAGRLSADEALAEFEGIRGRLTPESVSDPAISA
ncbi:hypothetical protein [Frondihabitans australicus]|uniref:Uncharacterized protein n=1 Tax=Frondihabitans australicus TaxID=386892 RepID=A0A495IGH2_9MICO|nr:hypothetical protein [Frondihabitans australicus]RKR74421.1 hypothetical protein C8E83_1533 [Frondihabitans australicus]